MNWLDYGVLIMLLFGTLLGAMKGFIHSLFRFVGVVVSLIISKRYYKFFAASIIESTEIEKIVEVFASKKVENGALDILWSADNVFGDFSSQITMIIINCISLFIVFIIVKLCFSLLEYILKGIFKLPVLRTLNYSGGALLGLLGSVLSVIILYAILVPISFLDKFAFLEKAVEMSVLSKYFCPYNFILKWMIG